MTSGPRPRSLTNPPPSKKKQRLEDVKNERPKVASDCITLEIYKQAQHNILLYLKIKLNFKYLPLEK